MTGGNLILFKRGDVWYMPMDSIDLTGHSNFTLNMYGASGAKPVIAGMALIPQGSWIHHGGGVWRCTSPFQKVFRLFVNGTSYINVETEIGNSGNIASVNTNGEFWLDLSTNTLYVYSGSTTVPPQNVEIIPGNHPINEQVGRPILKMENTSAAVIRNIEFRGGHKYYIIRINAPCNNIFFDTCIVSRGSWSGFDVGNHKNTMDYVNTIYITNCIIDKGWTLLENNTTAKLGGDGISLIHGVEGAHIRSNTILNWGHSGIDLVAWSSATNIWGVHNSIVYRNEVYAGNSGYMHGIEVTGVAGKNTNNIIKRNYFHDYTSTCHLGGNGNYFFSNIFANVRLCTIAVMTKKQPWGGDMYAYTNSETHLYLEYKNNWIVNNTFYNTGGYGLAVGSYTPFDHNVTGNKIHNNIWLNWNQHTPQPHGYGDVGLLIDSTVRSGIYYVRHNNFWNVNDSTGNVASIEGTKYTATGLNSAPACGANCTQNTQLNPRFGAFYTLSAASPAALKTGGIDLTGYMPTTFDDYWGHPWRSVGPSRGAIQY
jgi:hypothetical protein